MCVFASLIPLGCQGIVSNETHSSPMQASIAPGLPPQQLIEYVQQVEHIRQLPFDRSRGIPIFRSTFNSLPTSFDAPAVSSQFPVLLQLLGITSPTFNVQDYLLKLYREQYRGMFDTRTGEVVVLDDATYRSPNRQEGEAVRDAVPSPEFSLFIVHELTHVLQDQSLRKLSSLIPRRDSNFQLSDPLLAHQALIEGDATFVMTQYHAGNLVDVSLSLNQGAMARAQVLAEPRADTEVLRSGPMFFQYCFLFPYLNGLDFVSRLLREGGWEVVNRAYDYPPNSSEQILHPVKYLEGEQPHHITVAPEWWSRTSGASIAFQGTLGEIGISAMFAPDLAQAPDVSGWGGDLAVLLDQAGGEPWVVWVSSWDTLKDADRFYDHLAAYAETRKLTHWKTFRQQTLVVVLAGTIPEQITPTDLWTVISVRIPPPEIPPVLLVDGPEPNPLRRKKNKPKN